MSLFFQQIRNMSDEDLGAYLRETDYAGYARGTRIARDEMGNVLEALAKRCEASGGVEKLAVLCTDVETNCFRPDDVAPIHTDILYLDARTIRAFKHYISGR
jgi:hypothetical protein